MQSKAIMDEDKKMYGRDCKYAQGGVGLFVNHHLEHNFKDKLIESGRRNQIRGRNIQIKVHNVCGT